jgi:hypothetical protein
MLGLVAVSFAVNGRAPGGVTCGPKIWLAIPALIYALTKVAATPWIYP